MLPFYLALGTEQKIQMLGSNELSLEKFITLRSGFFLFLLKNDDSKRNFNFEVLTKFLSHQLFKKLQNVT